MLEILFGGRVNNELIALNFYNLLYIIDFPFIKVKNLIQLGLNPFS